MTFQKIEDALVSVTEKTYRSFAPEGEEPPYIIWDHDGQAFSLCGDGETRIQVLEGTVDLITKTEDDPLFGQIQKAMNNAGVGFRYNSKQYEESAGVTITHHEWVWQLPMEV